MTVPQVGNARTMEARLDKACIESHGKQTVDSLPFQGSQDETGGAIPACLDPGIVSRPRGEAAGISGRFSVVFCTPRSRPRGMEAQHPVRRTHRADVELVLHHSSERSDSGRGRAPTRARGAPHPEHEVDLTAMSSGIEAIELAHAPRLIVESVRGKDPRELTTGMSPRAAVFDSPNRRPTPMPQTDFLAIAIRETR